MIGITVIPRHTNYPNGRFELGTVAEINIETNLPFKTFQNLNVMRGNMYSGYLKSDTTNKLFRVKR